MTKNSLEILQESNEGFIPPKPDFQPPKNTIGRSLVAIGLFVVISLVVFQLSIFELLILGGVILIHETGHLIAMNLFNYKDDSIFFIPIMTSFSYGEQLKTTDKRRIIILTSGPIPGIILGFLCLYFNQSYHHEGLQIAGQMFLWLNIANLLPILPLDAGKLFGVLFFRDSYLIQTIFLGLSIIALMSVAGMNNDYLIFSTTVSVLFILMIRHRMIIHNMRKAIGRSGLALKKCYYEITNQEYWKIRRVVLRSNKFFKNINPDVDQYHQTRETQIVAFIKMAISESSAREMTFPGKLLVVFIYALILAGCVLLLINFWNSFSLI